MTGQNTTSLLQLAAPASTLSPAIAAEQRPSAGPPSAALPVPRASAPLPHLGLVCVTLDSRCRFQAVTRRQFNRLAFPEQRECLRQLYWQNLQRLNWALSFCASRGIRLYRVTSGLFPMSERPLGRSLLQSFAANLSGIGRRAAHLGIRIVAHPEKSVVLNSRSRRVVDDALSLLERHALWFDLMGLPRSSWSAIIVRGGQPRRETQFVRAIRELPNPVRARVCLENDETSSSAEQVLSICRRAGVPMVFDNLRHAIREDLGGYDHPSFEHFTRLARETWPDPRWQIVRLANGRDCFLDRNQSHLIETMPDAFRGVQWIEVDAVGKEVAIADLSIRMCSD